MPAAVPVSVPVGRQRGGVNENPVKDPVKCFRCGGKHLVTACKFIDAECFNCGQERSHIQSMPQQGEAKQEYGQAWETSEATKGSYSDHRG